MHAMIILEVKIEITSTKLGKGLNSKALHTGFVERRP
jgi:hypothetical protein